MEFALEDARVMRVREVRKKRREPDSGGQRGAQNSGSRGNDEIVEATVGRKSKKVEWQLKCKEKRLRRREKKTDLTHSQEVSRGDKKKVREDGEMCENGDVRRGVSTNKKQVASENGQQFVGGNKKKGSVNGQTRKFEYTAKRLGQAVIILTEWPTEKGSCIMKVKLKWPVVRKELNFQDDNRERYATECMVSI